MHGQREVGEGVLSQRQPLDGIGGRMEASRQVHIDIIANRHLGKTPKATPDPERGTLFQQDFAIAFQQQHGDRALRQRPARTPRRQLGDPRVTPRDAVVAHRTLAATRPGARANRCADIHHSLRIRGDVLRVADRCIRQQRFGGAP